MKQQRNQVSVTREKALLVSVALPDRPWMSDDPCQEIRGLAATAGAVVVGELTQKRQEIHPATYIGSGKVKELCEQAESAGADVVIFDNDLAPAQARNLEKARLQVELAQLEYSLPRLKNLWTHLSRQVGGGGIGLRGPGETQLEVDRRLATARIRELKRRLAQVHARKQREVQSREGEDTVSLVGYTNAGKSRLMNALTGAGVHVEDKLFSTLGTRTRQWHMGDGSRMLLSDTVGFIRDLPHHLVASFRATLEEARQAKLLLHVVDASSEQAEEHIRAVNAVLTEIGAGDNRVLLVLTQVDKLADRSRLDVLMAHHPRAVAVSSVTGEGLGALEDAVREALCADFADAEVKVDARNGKLLAFLNAHADIYRQEFHPGANEVVIRCRLPRHLLRHVEGPAVQVSRE